MWELDCEEGWAPKNWCFWTLVLEKTLESLLYFFGRNDAEAEIPVLWPAYAVLPHWKRLWCWEGLRAGGEGKDIGWDGWMTSLTRWMWVWVNSGSWWWQGGLACCDSWGHKKSRTQLSDWTELNWATNIFTSLHIWVQVQFSSVESPCSPRDSRVFSNTTVQKHQFFGAQPSSQCKM